MRIKKPDLSKTTVLFVYLKSIPLGEIGEWKIEVTLNARRWDEKFFAYDYHSMVDHPDGWYAHVDRFEVILN